MEYPWQFIHQHKWPIVVLKTPLQYKVVVSLDCVTIDIKSMNNFYLIACIIFVTRIVCLGYIIFVPFWNSFGILLVSLECIILAWIMETQDQHIYDTLTTQG